MCKKCHTVTQQAAEKAAGSQALALTLACTPQLGPTGWYLTTWYPVSHVDVYLETPHFTLGGGVPVGLPPLTNHTQG